MTAADRTPAPADQPRPPSGAPAERDATAPAREPPRAAPPPDADAEAAHEPGYGHGV